MMLLRSMSEHIGVFLSYQIRSIIVFTKFILIELIYLKHKETEVPISLAHCLFCQLYGGALVKNLSRTNAFEITTAWLERLPILGDSCS